jgi:hypothetical protein
MAARKRYAPCVFLPACHKDNLPAGSVVFDVSSYADYPYCTFSPIWAHGGIPVPGMPGAVSDTVEGIWQGLKVIRGKTALHLLRGRGKKRGGKKPSGHRYGGKLLGLIEARYKIYKPAYDWMLAHRVDHALIEGFLDAAFRGVTQHFHDLGNNADINDAERTVAHASFLVQYLDRLCAARAGG